MRTSRAETEVVDLLQTPTVHLMKTEPSHREDTLAILEPTSISHLRFRTTSSQQMQVP